MKLTKLLCRASQTSLLNEELTETRAIFECEHNGTTGHLVMDLTTEGRDCDTDYFCTIPAVTMDDIEDGRVDEAIWSMTPETETLTPELNAIVARSLKLEFA